MTKRSNGIRNEHSWLLTTIRKLKEGAGDGDGSDKWWSALDKAFHQFSKD